MKKILYIFSIIAIGFGLSSCDDFLTEDSFSTVDPVLLEDSEETVNQIVMGTYNTLSGNDFFGAGTYLIMTNFDCDYATGADWAFGNVGAGNPLTFWGKDNLWKGSYIIIHRANRGIAIINGMKKAPEDARLNALAELKFLKAWAYFQLVRNYGRIPLFKQSISEGVDPNQPLSSVEDVYGHIIELLTEAEGMYSAKDERHKLGRASKGAAKSLLAKVYLTIASSASTVGTEIEVKGGKQFDENGAKITYPQVIKAKKVKVAGFDKFNSNAYFKLARDKAKDVIDTEGYILFPFHDIWVKGNRNKGEHIWSLQALSGNDKYGNPISRDYIGIFKTDGTLEGNWYGLSDHWFHMFEANDLRATDGVVHRWIGAVGTYYYYPDTYKNKVLNQEAYDSQGNKFTGTELYYDAAKGWTLAKLNKFANVSDRTSVMGDFHFPLLRYADVLLIFAEAENELAATPSADAYKYLNDVRKRSNATELNGLSQAAFRSAVIEERARELALEADRRYDLLRWGIYKEVMDAIDIDFHGILKRRANRNVLYPYPQPELNANKAISAEDKQHNNGW